MGPARRRYHLESCITAAFSEATETRWPGRDDLMCFYTTVIRPVSGTRVWRALQSHRSTDQVAGVNTAAGDESYLSGRRLNAVANLGWRGYAGVAA